MIWAYVFVTLSGLHIGLFIKGVWWSIIPGSFMAGMSYLALRERWKIIDEEIAQNVIIGEQSHGEQSHGDK